MPITRKFDSFEVAVLSICARFASLREALEAAVEMEIDWQFQKLQLEQTPDEYQKSLYKLRNTRPAQFLRQGLPTYMFDEEGESIQNERSEWFGPVVSFRAEFNEDSEAARPIESDLPRYWWWKDQWNRLIVKIFPVDGSFIVHIYNDGPAIVSKEMADAWADGWDMHNHMPSDEHLQAALYWISKILSKNEADAAKSFEIPF